MQNLGTLWKTIIAVISFLFFGWISMITGAYDWQEVFQSGLLGVIMVFVVFVNNGK